MVAAVHDLYLAAATLRGKPGLRTETCWLWRSHQPRGPPRRALLVPAKAIQRHGQVSSVYVVQDGVARLRLIQAGRWSSEGVEVLAGLDAGELVVTSPLVRLVDGARVTSGGAPTAPGGAS